MGVRTLDTDKADRSRRSTDTHKPVQHSITRHHKFTGQTQVVNLTGGLQREKGW